MNNLPIDQSFAAIQTLVRDRVLPVMKNDGPWKLHQSEADTLARFGSPVGGDWPSFVALLAGTSVITARDDGFIVDLDAVAPTRAELIQSFTLKLVPPQTMAGMAVAIGLHPILLLQAAGLQGTSNIEVLEECYDAAHQVGNVLNEELERITSTVLLSSHITRDGVRNLIETAVIKCRARLQHTETANGISALVGDDGMFGIGSVADDLIETVLLPSGVLSPADDDGIHTVIK